jgi:signal transduction histidine kinase
VQALAQRWSVRELKRQRDDLLRLQLQKERLTAFVVHDLKNPVNAMDLHAQLLLRQKGLSESARESATHIRTAARQLTQMILNLLDLSKGDEGQLSPKRSYVDLPKLVSEVLSELGVYAEGHGVTLKGSIKAERLHVDEDLFRRTLTNLVENAVRHAPQGTSVTVSAVTVEGGTELRVADEGPGVPPEMREKVFDPFVQVDAGDRLVGRGSRGLGLSFCKLAVEAHGGRIWIEDGAPGAVFCMRLPHGL